MTSYPGLLNHYLKFCHLRNHHENGVLDLGKYPFYYPITLLPILNLIAKDSIEYIPHYNPAVQTYISIVLLVTVWVNLMCQLHNYLTGVRI